MSLRLKNSNILCENNGFLPDKDASLKSNVSPQNISFKGEVIDYADISKINQKIDKILGKDSFFTKACQNSTFALSDSKIHFQKQSVVKDLFEAIKYPFVKLPMDIFDYTCLSLEKTSLRDKIKNITESDAFKQRNISRNKEKNGILVRNVLEEYFPIGDDLESCLNRFSRDAAAGISKTVKNYESRHERTLNRACTATVSAFYSAHDFYNISMLQKDNKDEAKKAQKARFKQEMTRMAISASLTYLTMSALEKYTKKSVMANALVIALSALISEVGSRLLSKTPLHPLTSEEAAQIAYKKSGSVLDVYLKNDPIKNIIIEDTKTARKEKEEKLFKKFENQSFEPDKQKDKKQTKSFLKKIGLVFTIASFAALISKGIKGEFSAKIAKRKLFNENKSKILDFIQNKTDKLDDNIQNAINSIDTKQKDAASKFSFFEKIKEKTTTKEKIIYPQEVLQKLQALKQTKEGDQIEQLLNTYIDHTQKLLSNGAGKVSYKAERFLIASVYEGITKLTKTMYQIVSMPASLLTSIIDGVFFKNSQNAFKKIARKTGPSNPALYKTYKKEIIALKKIFEKYKDSKDCNKKIVEQIKKKTRAFELGAETGELANLSRTMVTAISTYFFVNDYTNKVLIESGGKDVVKAKEERNGRIAHKLSNFVINGTLMNLFNSIFKTPLNNSLIEASMIAAATETTNEFLVRKSICQPVGKMKSKQAILNYEEKQINRKGPLGTWSRFFMKITGKKTLTGKDSKQLNDDKKLDK